jgi:hypothetical protein
VAGPRGARRHPAPGRRPDLADLPAGGRRFLIDVEGAEIALLDDGLEDTLSPEDAAIRIEEQPGGLMYDEGPGRALLPKP